jgi:hypothetical protein
MNILLQEDGNTIWIDPDSVNAVTGISHRKHKPSWFFKLLGGIGWDYHRFVIHVGKLAVYVKRADYEVLESIRCDVINVLERGGSYEETK